MDESLRNRNFFFGHGGIFTVTTPEHKVGTMRKEDPVEELSLEYTILNNDLSDYSSLCDVVPL